MSGQEGAVWSRGLGHTPWKAETPPTTGGRPGGVFRAMSMRIKEPIMYLPDVNISSFILFKT